MATEESEGEVLFNGLVDEFAERYRRRERPSVQEYADRYPQLADDIRDLFPALAEIEQVKQEQSAPSPSGSGRPAAALPLRQLGDYRLLREVGRGGMGVVYEAEQVSLGRRVALKILPPTACAGAMALERFQREARAAARLHHTNIVPVFGVGEHDGLPYYVMQFIQGQGLDTVLDELKRMREISPANAGRRPEGGQSPNASGAGLARSLLTGEFGGVADPTAEAGTPPAAGAAPPERPGGADTARAPVTPAPSSSSVVLPGQSGAPGEPGGKQPSYWQSVANIGVQVAGALEYAHKQGVLHRDVKPSNLLLDTRGTVWVTDFGLAKADDQQNLTQTGDILGTLRYLPPEAFDGKRDRRGDIYALGLTLYELVSLRPAFDEHDRHRLIKQVTTAEPPRLERLGRGVPRDLVTIVHKAIDRDPGGRYQTAAELAADLQCFLDDEPIKARRVSPPERLARWARQNKALATALTGLFLVLAAVTVASVLVAGGFEHIAREKETARGQAVLAEGQAVEAQRLAEDRADTIRRNLYCVQMNLAQQSWKDVLGLARSGQLLTAWRTDDPAQDLRGWEWYYLESLRHKDLLTLGGHGDRVLAVAFSPDGRRLASGGNDGTARVWDARTGEPIRSFSGKGPLTAVDWNPDGTALAAAAASGKVFVWDVSGDREPAALTGHQQQATAVRWAPDGKRLASAGAGGVVIIWDVAAGRPRLRIPAAGRPVTSLAWSPDGDRLAAGADGAVRVWDAGTGREVRALPNPDALQPQVAWSPDGRTIACTSENSVITLWEAASGQKRRVLAGHAGEVLSLAFSRDGKTLASAGWDGAVRLWDPETGQEVRALRGHTHFINALSWDADGRRLASASDDRTVKVWDATRDQQVLALRGHGWRVSCVAWRADSRRVASSSWDRTVRVWDAQTGQELAVLRGHTSLVRAVSWSPDGKQLASGSFDRTVRLWDAESGKELAVLQGHKDDVQGVSWHPDGRRLVSASIDKTARIWDTATRRVEHELPGHTQGLFWASWSPDGRHVATASNDGSVKVWDADTGEEVVSLEAHPTGAYAVCWSPDGSRLATGGFDQKIRLWDAATWQEAAAPLHGHTDLINAISWSPDGARLASSSRDHQLKLWDPVRGQEIVSFRTHSNQVPWVAWSPCGLRLATASHDHTVHILDAEPGYVRERSPALLPALDRRLAANPDDVDDLRLRADLHEHLGHNAEAQRDRDRGAALIRSDPGGPPAPGR